MRPAQRSPLLPLSGRRADQRLCRYIEFERKPPDRRYLITRIKEKERISSHANTGAYGFASGANLLQYCRRVVDKVPAQTLTESQPIRLSPLGLLLLLAGHGHRRSRRLPILDIVRLRADAGGRRAGGGVGGAEIPEDQVRCERELACEPVAGSFSAEPTASRRDPMRLHSFYANLVLRSKSNLRICFDLDGTLVTDPLQPGDYTTVKPLPDNIGICRQLKEQGHIIIINTSRGMAMHHGAPPSDCLSFRTCVTRALGGAGNVGMVMKDIAKTTFDQLDELGIPYDEIHFGKPHADVYIDGKSVNPTTEFAKTLGARAIVPPVREAVATSV